MRDLYVVISSTPNRIGHFIRRITGQPYNHASISFDPDLKTMFTFARSYYRTPFYGGFVIETPSRYCINGVNATIEVYRIAIPEDNYQTLKSHIDSMCHNQKKYLYNHLAALVFPLGIRIPAKDAFVCVEFCVDSLHKAGIDVDPTKHYSLKEIQKLLQPHLTFTGPMPQDGNFDSVYFSKKPLPHPVYATMRSFGALLPRIGKK